MDLDLANQVQSQYVYHRQRKDLVNQDKQTFVFVLVHTYGASIPWWMMDGWKRVVVMCARVRVYR